MELGCIRSPGSRHPWLLLKVGEMLGVNLETLNRGWVRSCGRIWWQFRDGPQTPADGAVKSFSIVSRDRLDYHGSSSSKRSDNQQNGDVVLSRPGADMTIPIVGML